MRTLYLDCSMGAAGDMLSAALLELLPEEEQRDFVEELNRLGIPKVCFRPEPSVKCGISGTHMTVLIDGAEEEVHDHVHTHEHDHEHEHEHDHVHEHDHAHEHEHSHEHEHDHAHEHEHSHGHGHSHNNMAGIAHVLKDHMALPEEIRKDVLEVYRLIAEAESHAHGMPVDQIHFHEVGNMDAVADVTAVCMLMHRLHPDRVIASPVNTGTGHVHCAHGLMPVPAPATAFLLQGIPVYDNGIASELCTPTGAALLKHFVDEFGPKPVMVIEKTGYGMGKKDFEAANCVRAMLGEMQDTSDRFRANDEIIMLSCNVDDMTAEEIGFAFDRLLEAGAADVFTIPVTMKKNRPGVLIEVIAGPEKKNALVEALFRYTTTIGIREARMDRYILERRTETVRAGEDTVRVKVSAGFGAKRSKYEYDDLAAIAVRDGVSLGEVRARFR